MPLLAQDVGDEWPPHEPEEEDEWFWLLLLLMDDEWRQQFLDIGLELRIGWRRSVYRMTRQQTAGRVLAELSTRLGATSRRPRRPIKGMIWRFLTLARSYIIEAMNAASLDLYALHPDVVEWVQWVTAQDERVCPQCKALEGRKWRLGDPNMLRPVADTHLNCRCTLVPVAWEDAAYWNTPPDDSLPTTISFEEWLADRGENQLLNQLRRTRKCLRPAAAIAATAMKTR